MIEFVERPLVRRGSDRTSRYGMYYVALEETLSNGRAFPVDERTARSLQQCARAGRNFTYHVRYVKVNGQYLVWAVPREPRP